MTTRYGAIRDRHALPVTADNLPETTRWLAAQRATVRRRLAEDGVVHLRGLPLSDPSDLATVATVLVDGDCPRLEPFAARQHLYGAVHTSPQWRADREMCPHNEQSYATQFPRTLLLAHPPGEIAGGRTLLADGVRLLRHLDPALLRRFETLGWQLVRNFRPHMGMSWSQAFGSADRTAVQDYCDTHDIAYRWHADGTLQTRQRRPAMLAHPRTSLTTWFNQVAFLNQWSLQDDERAVLLGAYGPEGLPFNTFYGDGSPIDRADLAELQDALDAVTVAVDWAPGDVLLVDNVRMAHGRTSHTGHWPLWELQAEPASRER